MENPNDFGRDFFRVGTLRCGLLTGFLGIAIAFSLLFLGFWKTLFIVVFFVGGFALGAYSHKIEWVKNLINSLFPPKGE